MPATLALKLLPVTPGPVQVPPNGDTLLPRLTTESVKQTLGGMPVNIMFGKALTVMVNVLAVPIQFTPAFWKLGVTVMVPLIFPFVVLVVINDAMFPVPEAGKPMPGLLLVQVNIVPAVAPVNTIAVVG